MRLGTNRDAISMPILLFVFLYITYTYNQSLTDILICVIIPQKLLSDVGIFTHVDVLRLGLGPLADLAFYQ